MNRTVIIAALVSVITMSSTCKKNSPGCHFSYTIKNTSNTAIYFSWSRDSALASLSYNPASSPATYRVNADTDVKNVHRTCFENEILASATKTLYIFIFDAHTLETVPWDSVKKFNMLEKRYALSETQLDSAAWAITYP